MPPKENPTFAEIQKMCVRILDEVNGPGFGIVQSVLNELNRHAICSHERVDYVKNLYYTIYGNDG